MCKKLICLISFVLVLSLVSNASADLVAHWTFDEGGGTTVTDMSGNGADGTITGNPEWIGGPAGTALGLVNNGDYVMMPNSEAIKLRSTGNYTVTCWLQVQDTAGGIILQHGLGCSTWASWFLGVGGPEPDAARQEGNLVFGARSGNGSAYTGVAAPAEADTWVHVAATFDGTTLDQVPSIVRRTSISVGTRAVVGATGIRERSTMCASTMPPCLRPRL
jgi:hypothetical protein